MDDGMDSVMNDEQGIELYRQLSELWKRAGMHAHKWLSNSPIVLSQIPTEDRACKMDFNESKPKLKTLGVLWLAEEDVFTFQLNLPEKFVFWKRNFLKKIATLFDPLGMLAPYIIRAKILLQEMWAAGLDWDDTLLQI
ncbi:uncharacterized protein [Ptychodera flava]|uniref:uncharacterized protein n=1 Tax=Ptychodera flava TaxID=63121 RepID=UPI00396A2146